MNSMLTASFKHDDLVKELQNDMDKNLDPEFHLNECCIYRVHKKLRNVNEEAYTPQMVSIGPLHYGNERFANMKKIKRSYMKNFLEKRITIEKLDKLDNIFNYLKDKENMARNYYSKISKLTSLKYIIMILYDAIFIIELFMRNFEGTSDSFMSTTVVRSILILDLELLENQLPYFVLNDIYELASCPNMPSFRYISKLFFELFNNVVLSFTPFSLKHFTDWRRSTLLEKYVGSLSFSKKGYIWDLPCAMKLHESGVKFKKIEEQDKLSFEKHRHELQLPQLQIVDESECIFRNVMALEQFLYPNDTHICNYVYLMDCLIDTEKDVDLLVESEIISNLTGDKSSAANMFNRLCRNIAVSQSCYYEIGEELKKHCDNSWNKTMATLRRVYFSDLWRGTATIAAVVLLLLTVMQTICSILPVV